MPDDEHLSVIRRQLSGEVVGDEVGIRLVDGPFDGRTKIVRLDRDGNPPAGVRACRGAPTATRHVYRLAASADAASGWVYAYAGPEAGSEA